MIHPTRTNLLLLKEKALSVVGSVAILKGRRQALIRELLETSRPLLRSREEIRRAYGRGIEELQLTLAHEGENFVVSLAAAGRRDLGVEIVPGHALGLSYREVHVGEGALRTPEKRGYDYRATTPHLEEAFSRFETIVEQMLEMAAYEGKLKRLGEELLRVTRRIRVLEERILPRLQGEIRSIAQYLGEREREAFYRLKRFKGRG
jgi:V/A-type H+-transporting ATPase subunit D